MAGYRHSVIVNARNRALLHGAPGRSPAGPDAGNKPEEAKLNFSDIWQAVADGKWIILLSCVVITTAVAAYTMMITPIYESGSLVFVERMARATPGMATQQGTVEQRDLNQEVGILQQSVDLSKEVAGRLMAIGQENPVQYPILFGEDGQPLDSTQVAYRLGRQVRFWGDFGQSVISMTAESSSPWEAAAIANEYAAAYQEYAVVVSRQGIVAKKRFVEEQAQKFWAELNRVQNQWAAFAQGKQVYTFGEEGERLVTEMSLLRTRRDDAQFELDQTENSLALLQERLDKLEENLPSLAERVTMTRTSSEIESKISSMDQKIAELELQAEQYYLNNPSLRGNESRVQGLADIVRQIKHFRDKRDELTETYIDEASKIPAISGSGVNLTDVVDLRRRIAETTLALQEKRQELGMLDAKIRTYDGHLAALPRQAIELEQLQREKARIEQLYSRFSDELTAIRIAEEAQLGYVKIMRPAGVPGVPLRPNKKQNIVLGVLLGLGLGIGLAFVKSTMSQRLRKPEDLQQSGYAIVGVIPPLNQVEKTHRRWLLGHGKPQESAPGAEIVALKDPWSLAAENYRLLRVNIQATGLQGRFKTLLVTSPEAGDGKTVTAVNLAVAMAQGGRRTLLVEADMRRPTVHRKFGLSNAVGLAQVLQGDVGFEGACMATDVENLFVLPAGTVKAPSAELLGSQAMAALLTELRSAYDVVIFDSPPVLAVTDPVVLALQCDATILVATAEKTDVRALDAAKQILSAVGVPVNGVVLNRFDVTKMQGGGYGYGYGSYAYAGEQGAA